MTVHFPDSVQAFTTTTRSAGVKPAGKSHIKNESILLPLISPTFPPPTLNTILFSFSPSDQILISFQSIYTYLSILIVNILVFLSRITFQLTLVREFTRMRF